MADTLNSRIAAIPNAVFRRSNDGRGRTVTKGGKLNGELGLAIAPDGHILTVNGLDGRIVETTGERHLFEACTIPCVSDFVG